ncbi:MAG: hypothetical protein Q9188_001410 [Gyalolechia gomerana]
MSSPSSKAASSLARHRPAILAITAIAAGFIFYAFGHSLQFLPKLSENTRQNPNTSLRRSNAQRRRPSRRRTNTNGHETLYHVAPDCIASISYERRDPRGRRVYGRCIFTTNNGSHAVWLTLTHLPSAVQIHEQWDIDLDQALIIRQYLEEELLDSFFAQEMPSGAPGLLPHRARERFIAEFANAAQISAISTEAAMNRYQTGALQDHVCRQTHIGGVDEAELPGTTRELSSADLGPAFLTFLDAPRSEPRDDETIAETESNRSYEAEGENDGKPSQDQNLMNLLYRIAEDQSKKEGVVHRGVTCNSCNVLPIHGTRYRCTNCHDYDLCEQCEALQVHDKTHLFYKIRIPAPFLGNRQPAPVWYPGRLGKFTRDLTTEFKMMLSTMTGVQDRQVDAYWDQFQCLAASRYPNDPHGFGIAIDRQSFDRCFVPNITPRPPPPNLIYDRMFSFYDTNDDGLIDFEEFLRGIACIANNGKELRGRIFRAYDVDGDGFVDRKDFLRMFRANYALTKELTRQIISSMNDELFDEEDARELVTGGQPISSIFSGAIPRGGTNNPGEGKTENRHGDQIIHDGQGVMHQEDSDQVYGVPQYGDDVVLDNAELAQFGSREHPWLPGNPHLTLATDDDTWPKSWVTSRDVEEALGRMAASDSIKDRTERALVLCAAQERVQQDRWIREAFRRRTATSRWQARQFYLDGELAAQPPWTSTEAEPVVDEDSYFENDLCSLRIKALDRNEEPQFIEGFHEGIIHEIQEQWPDYPDLAGIPDRFSTWVRKRYKWHNLAEALAPTRSDVPKATAVVWKLFHDFFAVGEFVIPRRSSDAIGLLPYSPTLSTSPDNVEEVLETEREVDGNDDGERRSVSPKRTSDSTEFPQLPESLNLEGPSFEPAAEEALSRSDNHRSRSTTSVSTKGLGVLVGERCEENETAARWPDVRREVICQVTQESMNELLDPMFKLREALALEVMKTRRERELHKDEIGECFRNDFAAKIMALFQEYQKRWYQSSREEFDTLNSSQAIKFVEFILRCFEKPEFRDLRPSNGRIAKAKHTNSVSLQEATEAMIQLEQSVAKEVHGESPSSMSEQQQATANTMPSGDSNIPDSRYPAVADDLHEGVFAFDDDVSAEETTKQKSLELLLADSGYGIVTPPVEDFEGLDTSLVSSPGDFSVQGAKHDELDPTLPQNRPDSLVEWEDKYGFPQAPTDTKDIPQPLSRQSVSEHAEPETLPPLSTERLLILAVWNVIEEDDASRGGPGRLNLHDYELIMEGDKGQGLGFVGSWIETAAF